MDDTIVQLPREVAVAQGFCNEELTNMVQLQAVKA